MCISNYKSKTKIIIFNNNKIFLKNFLKHFKNKKKNNVGLTGGKSWPKKYRLLKNFKNWNKNYFFLTDERNVSYLSSNSNYKQLKNFFKKENFKNILTSKNIKKNLQSFNKSIKSPDINLISIGEDGHIFSWFREDIKKIENLKKKSLIINRDDFLRYSISLKVLKKKTKNLLLVDKVSKIEIFEKIFIKSRRLMYPSDLIFIKEIYMSNFFFEKLIKKNYKYLNIIKKKFIIKNF